VADDKFFYRTYARLVGPLGDWVLGYFWRFGHCGGQEQCQGGDEGVGFHGEGVGGEGSLDRIDDDSESAKKKVGWGMGMEIGMGSNGGICYVSLERY
jgi:hypothetical protein